MRVYFKGGKPVDLVKNYEGKVIYSRNLFSKANSVPGFLDGNGNIGRSSDFGLVSDFIAIGNEDYYVDISVPSKPTDKTFWGKYGYWDADRKFITPRLDFTPNVNAWSSKGMLNKSQNGFYVRVNVSFLNKPDGKLYLRKGQENIDYVVAPEDLTGTTATTSQGGDFS